MTKNPEASEQNLIRLAKGLGAVLIAPVVVTLLFRILPVVGQPWLPFLVFGVATIPMMKSPKWRHIGIGLFVGLSAYAILLAYIFTNLEKFQPLNRISETPSLKSSVQTRNLDHGFPWLRLGQKPGS